MAETRAVKGLVRGYVRFGNMLAPGARPGKDLLERATGEMTPSLVATRDLARYYALLEVARRRLKGVFSPRELEALAYALESMASIEHPDLLHLAAQSVVDSVRYEDLCGMAGIEDCQDFLRRVKELGLAEIWALVDAVGVYLGLPREERGEPTWRRLGLL